MQLGIRIQFPGAETRALMETQVGSLLTGMRWLLVTTTCLPIHSWLPQSPSGSTAPIFAPRSNSGSSAPSLAPLLQDWLPGVNSGSLLQKLIPNPRFNAPHIAIYWSEVRCTQAKRSTGPSNEPRFRYLTCYTVSWLHLPEEHYKCRAECVKSSMWRIEYRRQLV